MRSLSLNRFTWILGSLIAVALLIVLQGCANNPITAAKTIDQKAYALYGTFVVFEEQAVAIVVSPATPSTVKDAIRKADNIAKPVADGLLVAVRQYLVVQRQLAAGTTTNDKLAIATANLEKWVTQGEPAIRNLVVAVVGGK